MAHGDTLINAIIGAVATVLLTILPFSPLLGGAVAGYLQRGEYSDGAKVGALAGAFAAIPLAFLIMIVATFFMIVPASGGQFGVGVFFSLIFLAVALFVMLYTVGFGALGGMLGIALVDEFGTPSAPVDETKQ